MPLFPPITNAILIAPTKRLRDYMLSGT
jgi:hypothetical protein